MNFYVDNELGMREPERNHFSARVGEGIVAKIGRLVLDDMLAKLPAASRKGTMHDVQVGGLLISYQVKQHDARHSFIEIVEVRSCEKTPSPPEA